MTSKTESMRQDIVIIALQYEEPEYAETRKCIEATGLPVIWANRDGVGNYSRAFNEAFKNGIVWMPESVDPFKKASDFKYAWMISNITFDPQVPFELADDMDIELLNLAAIHPAMHGSDHRHQWPDADGITKIVPFIEWTAPMVRTSAFTTTPLNQELAYYYMDLDWCYRVKEKKLGNVAVCHSARVGHAYLRTNKTHRISQIRSALRDYWTPRSQWEMARLYGGDWKKGNWVETFLNLKRIKDGQ